MFYADLRAKPDGVFKRLTGVWPATFQEMCQALKTHLPLRGRKPKHSLEDRLLLTLIYWREYRTFGHIGQTYGLNESAVCRTVHAVETALLRSGQFTLPGRRALTSSDIAIEVVVVDATGCPVERPKKTAPDLQRQEEAPHPECPGRRGPEDEALVTSFSAGKKHDFRLLQQSRLALLPQTECLADSGYLRLAKCHPNSRLPKKKSKHHPLTQEQRRGNRRLSRERFVIEHVIRSLKIFRILAERYRNRRKRFSLRFNLIAVLYNRGLAS